MLTVAHLMKMRIALLFSLLLSFTHLFAGNIIVRDGANDLRMTENTYYQLKLNNSLAEFNTMDVKTSDGIFTKMLIPGYSKGGIIGQPELPVMRRLIEIPAGASARVEIINNEVKEYKLSELGIHYPIFPMQPPVPKTGEPVAFIYDLATYQMNAFNSNPIVSVEELGAMRGVRIGRVDIAPFKYNPATGIIRIYENIEFRIMFDNADEAASIDLKKTYSNHYFSPIFHSFLNYKDIQVSNRENFSRYPIKYVIISDRMFEAQLQPLIDWKIKKGFTVVEAYTDEPNVGTTTYSIKSFIQDLYDNATPEDPAPTFVLFVGDIDQVPTWTGQAAGHVTDLFYCEFTNDYFPEIFYGRFSAQNTTQLQPQVDKTLMYEQYTMPDPSYLNEAVMIAGMDGTFGPIHANGQINYGTENYFNEAHGIVSHTYLYPESGANAANIRQDISNGVCYANYTAHGSPDGWGDPQFSVSQVAAMANDGKYALLVGNACSTSEYQVSECFGEALLRAVNKGALGYIGASNSSYWDEDYYWGIGVGAISGDPPSYEETTLGSYDRTFHDHGEPFFEWYTTMDQMVFAGNLAVTEGAPGSAQYYWEAYNLLGDPSLMVYYSEPPALTVTYDPLIPLGSPSFTVTTEPYAYVALSMNGICYGAALADSTGVAVLSLEGLTTPGNADLVVTKQNAQPFLGTVLVNNPVGPYVMLNQYNIDDTGGNANGLADCGENILLDVELKNWGNSDAINVDAILNAADPYITSTDNYQVYGDIPAQDSVMQMGAYIFDVADSVPDQHQVLFDLVIEDETKATWSSSFSVTLQAPVLNILTMDIQDTISGNGNNNHRLDAGETVDLVVIAENSGHCEAHDAVLNLLCSSPYITVLNNTATLGTIAFGNYTEALFTIEIANDVPLGTVVYMNYVLSAGPYWTQKTFTSSVGLIVEDFESGNFLSFEWMHSGSMPWFITSGIIWEGAYSARSGLITDNQTSSLALDMDVAVDDSISFYRKVSCEDDPYNNDYDWLAFYIDDTEMGRWDGEVDWSRVAYPVSSGTHNFEWTYRKDYSVASGSDCAWLDFIVFPAMAPVVGVEANVKGAGNSISIYPNPAVEKTTLSINLQETMPVSVSLYNLMGQKVLDMTNQPSLSKGLHNIDLDTRSLEYGIYFCVFNCGDQKITRKLIVTR